MSFYDVEQIAENNRLQRKFQNIIEIYINIKWAAVAAGKTLLPDYFLNLELLIYTLISEFIYFWKF
jgi:hypothetical protein